MVLDDEANSLDTPLSTELFSSAVNVQAVKFCHFRYENVWLSIELIAHPTFPLHKIQTSHVKSLAVPMRVLALN